MFKRFRILSVSLLTIITICLTVSNTVLAAGTTSLSISKKSPNAGETFTVDINASSSAEISLSYNSEVLTMIGSSVDGQSGNNTFTFTGSKAQITFKAKAPGKSGLVVKSPSLTGSSVNIEVGGTVSQPDQAEESTADNSNNTAMSETNNDESIPLSEEPTNHIIVENKSIELLISEPTSIPLPSLVMGECKSQFGTFMGYQIEGGDANIYYIYGTNELGEEGWYMFDMLTSTLSRADIDGLVVLDSANNDIMLANEAVPVQDDNTISIDKRFIIASGIFVLAIVIIIIINLALRSRSRRLDELEDDLYDEDDYDDDFDKSENEYLETTNEEESNDDIEVEDETKELYDFIEIEEAQEDVPSELDKILDEQEAAVKKHKESIDLLDLNDL